MNQRDVLVRVRAIVAKAIRHRFFLPSVPDYVTLDDLCVDHIERAMIAWHIEEEWIIEFTGEEMELWRDMSELASDVCKRIARSQR